MLYYSLVVVATILFALQFLFNQKFQETYGENLKSSLVFNFYKSIVGIIIMLIIGKFQLHNITLFSVLMATAHAVVGFLMVYFSLKAFGIANLSVYSVFSMLGGMLLPFLLGISFYSEDKSIFKIICCLLIVLSVVLNIKSGNKNKMAILYYMAVFVLNGMSGVISKIHQSSSLDHTDSTGFMAISGIVSLLISGIWLLIKYKEIPLVKGKNLFYASGYGLFNGLGNLFLLISLASLPASVQYPLVTGGVIVVSTIISMIRREKLTVKNYISAAISFVASVLMALQY